MDVPQKIAALWQAHRREGLPDVAPQNKGELWVLDEVISGCVAFYLEKGGLLDGPRTRIAEDCGADLRRLLPELDGDAADYFGRLDEMVHLILGTRGTFGLSSNKEQEPGSD
jgi:hypothetical protein